MKTRKIFLMAVLFSVMLIGCGEIEELTVTIVRIETETTEWGCIGTNKKTIIKTTDNRMDNICGEWGKPGDKIKGYWKKGHFDPRRNGFRRTN